MKAVHRKWPMSIGVCLAVVAAVAPAPGSTIMMVVALPALWLMASLLVGPGWSSLPEAHRMVHLSVGGLVLTAVVSLAADQLLEPGRDLPQQAFLILAGPAALFLIHGLFLLVGRDDPKLATADLLDATAYLLLPTSLIATLVWPRLSATSSTGVRTTMMVLGVLSSAVFLLAMLLVIGRSVRAVGRLWLFGALLALAGTGWLALVGWAEGLATGRVFPALLALPPTLYLLAVGSDGFADDPVGGKQPAATHRTSQGRWLIYGAVGLSLVFLTSYSSAFTPIPFAVLCGGLTVARLAVTSADARRLQLVTESFGPLITDLGLAADGQARLERSSMAAAELLGRGGIVVEEVPSQATAASGYTKVGHRSVVVSDQGRIRIEVPFAVGRDAVPILISLANLVELSSRPGLVPDVTGLPREPIDDEGRAMSDVPSLPEVQESTARRVVEPSGSKHYPETERRRSPVSPLVDEWSGLPNQHDFELQGDLDNVALIVFYLHDLERVRDAVGSDAGTSFIRRMAARVERSFRHQSDRLWRGDGAKLIVVTPLDRRSGSDAENPGAASPDAASVDHGLWIENRRASLATPTALGMSFIAPAVSIGFTVVRQPTAATEALQQAEMALMFARDNNPRSTVEYTTELHARMARYWQIESSLAAGLDDLAAAGLSVHYQPLVEASSGQVKAVEALCRWDHPELGSVSPAEFIPIAEKGGVIAAIDDFVLRRAMDDLERLRAVSDDMWIQVNMSPTGLEPNRLAEVAKAILRHLGGNSPGITVEITESALGHQPVSDLVEAFTFLREADIGISLDDFGTGESNFERLSHLPFTQVKLANDFIRANDELLVANVVEVVHRLGMTCVVEGVETESQRQVATRGGGDLLQGWAFLPAVPLQDVVRYCVQLQEGAAEAERAGPSTVVLSADRPELGLGADESLPLGLHGASGEGDHDEAD